MACWHLSRYKFRYSSGRSYVHRGKSITKTPRNYSGSSFSFAIADASISRDAGGVPTDARKIHFIPQNLDKFALPVPVVAMMSKTHFDYHHFRWVGDAQVVHKLLGERWCE